MQKRENWNERHTGKNKKLAKTMTGQKMRSKNGKNEEKPCKKENENIKIGMRPSARVLPFSVLNFPILFFSFILQLLYL